ncbi:helix-turn-helix domain-containing protein [Nocardia rhizosphaerae]|uniref:Helix-turn-helix domain-containing protein n=1 Tax=Nocardia rhizosphaerae TaxID=1691571 RepID=A0ABV8L2N4_9NOCA
MTEHTTITVRASPGQPPGQAVEQWEALLSDTYIPLAVAPATIEGFGGRIAATEFDGLLVTSVQTAAQTVRRTPRLIAAADDRYILASMYVAGRGILHQDGRAAHVEVGSMVFYDSTRPYRWEIDEPVDKVVVQVPIDTLEAAGVPMSRVPSAIALGPDHPASAVGTYFCGLARVQQADPVVAELAGHGIGMLASALSLAAGSVPRGPGADELTRARIIAFMRRRFADADLTVDALAHRFAISRRTLYRLFEGEESPARRLLRMRLDHACQLLREGGMRIEEVAAAAGFSAERHFYRAFRAEFGMAPGEYSHRAIRFGTDSQLPGTA